MNKDKWCLVELGDPQPFNYWFFSSSREDQYASFKHKCKTLTELRRQTEEGTK